VLNDFLFEREGAKPRRREGATELMLWSCPAAPIAEQAGRQPQLLSFLPSRLRAFAFKINKIPQ